MTIKIAASCSRSCTPPRSRRDWPVIWKASIAGSGGPSISWSTSTVSFSRTFRMSSGSTRGSRRWSELSSSHQVHTATPRGCSSNCSTSRAGFAFVSGYLIQSVPDMKALDGPQAPTATSPICTPGARCPCLAPARSAWNRRRDSSRRRAHSTRVHPRANGSCASLGWR